MTAIKAIETRYAGCRFRSRTEARWAVTFDRMQFTWEYEAEGYEVERRIGASGPMDETFPYLPDFYLPKLDVLVEVKGSLTHDEMCRLVDAAAYLSAPHGGCAAGRDVVVLGPLPHPVKCSPIRLHMCKGNLYMAPWSMRVPRRPGQCPLVGRDHELIGDDSSGLDPWWEPGLGDILLQGMSDVRLLRRWGKAVAAGRSARFEHGETP